MPPNNITIPQIGTANYAPGPDGTPASYQRDSTPVPNATKADGRAGTGSNVNFIPSRSNTRILYVPNGTKADGQLGAGSNLVFIPETTPVPNSAKADGRIGTGSNVSFLPSRSNTRITYVPNVNKADGLAPITAPTNLDINVTGVTSASLTFFAALTWNSTIVPDSFEIWRQVNSDSYALLATVSGSALTYSDDCTTELLMPGYTFHTYKVRAKVGVSYSSFSNEIQACKGFIFSGDTATTALSYPLLVVSFFEISILNNSALQSVAFPKMKRNCNHLMLNDNPNLTSWSAPFVTECGVAPAFEEFSFSRDNFTILDLSPIVNINSTALSCGGNTNLTTVIFNANPIIPDAGNAIIFEFCALSAATVNRILAIAVANNLTQAFIKLDGGTNSAPTGQGITDKNTLITNGCNVITN